MKKAILINVKEETITEVIVTKDLKGSQLQSIYGLLGCNLVDIVNVGENDIYVDDEGLLSLDNNSKLFSYKGHYQPLAGNGLIMGYDNNTGDSIDVTITLDEVKKNVKFLTINDVTTMF